MRTVAITGGAGFIGSHLVHKLINENYKVIIIDNLSTGNKENVNKHASFLKVDIRDYSSLRDSLKKVDVVFHLAALPRIQRSVINPLETNEVNVQGTLNVLEASRINKVKKIIFASSSSVYGNQKTSPLNESMEPQPLSPYALQKYIGEKYCLLYSKLYGLTTICLRYFSVYGQGQNESDIYATVIGKFLYLRRLNKPLPIYGAGTNVRDFTYIDDIVSATIRSMDIKSRNIFNIINICSGHGVSINKIAHIVGGKQEHLSERIGESSRICGSNSKAKAILLWRPKMKIFTYLKSQC